MASGSARDPVGLPPVGAAPPARRGDTADVLHGRRVPDPYRDLEDPAAAATRTWAAAHDRRARAVLDALPGRAGLAASLARHLAAGSRTAPVHAGGRAFALHRPPGAPHAVLEVREPDGAVRVLLDPAGLDATAATTLDAWFPSPTGRRVAVALSAPGAASRLRVLDVTTGAVVDGPVERTAHSPVAWLDDDELVWVRADPGPDRAAVVRRVFRHRVGTDPADDVEVAGPEPRPGRYLAVRADPAGRWLVVDAVDGTAPGDGLWVVDLRPPRAGDAASLALDARTSASSPAVRVLRPEDGVGVRARIEADGRLWLVTTHEAPRGRLCTADPADPGRWSELVAEDPDTVLTAARLVAGVAVLVRARDGVGELHRHDAVTGAPLGVVDLPGPGAVTGLGLPTEGTDLAVGWTSHTDPPSVLHVDVATGAVTDRDRVGEWAGAARRVVHRLSATAPDGTRVPVLVLAPDGADRPRPALLTGYGGFGRVVEPAHSPTALAWVEAGGVWAQAILRGGGEGGEASHRAGAFPHHRAGTEDLHAAADALVEGGWTTPDRLALTGGSHGGLRVAEAVVECPGRYAAAVCASPLTDLVRSEHLGMGPTWRAEYGSADDPAGLDALLAASPYHRVAEGTAYPAVLVTASDADTRVDAAHARKLVAALDHATTGGPVLLRRETDTGHGARSLDRTVALAVDQIAFLAAATGLDLATGLPAAGLDPAAGLPTGLDVPVDP